MTTAAQDEFNELMRDKEHRSNHPEDDDARSFLSLSDDDDDDATPVASEADEEDELPRPSMTSARHVIPRTRFEANTGPKGVIADAQNFRDARRNNRESLRSTTTLASRVQSGFSLKELERREKHAEREEGNEDDDEDDDEDLNDDFMSKWRQNRLREMQVGGLGKTTGSRDKRKWYGHLTAVDGEGYLDAIDNVAADVVVLVYIYDDMVRLPS